MFLAGDVGGTKTLVGLYDAGDRRPRLIAARSYATNTYRSFTEILSAFARDVPCPSGVAGAAVGVAGPVVGDRARLTNIEWDISTQEIAAALGTTRVRLLNDLEAMANAADSLATDELVVLQRGIPRDDGNAVVIAAGTGLGEAYLYRMNGRLVPAPSEGGHADFAPHTDREIDLLRMLRDCYGRAEVEHVLSGPGLLNLHRFTHDGEDCPSVRGTDDIGAPAGISQAALQGTCSRCVEALSIFVSVYGAEAGNLALRGVATSGVYVGGGIAPKILPALQDGRFMDAFRDKGVMSELAARVPVKVILADAGLLGAALCAQNMSAHLW